MSKSSIYKELTYKEVESIVKKHFNKSKFEYSLLSGGMFNTTYLLTLLPSKDKYVLRVGPVNRHLLLSFEHNLMNAENYFYNLCKNEDIPVSEVVVLDTNKEIIDRDYMIVKFIESSPLSSLNISETQKNKLYEDVGRCVFKIHCIEGEKFGRLSQIVSGKGFLKWSEYLKSEIDEWAFSVEKTSIYTKEQIQSVKQVFIKYQNILDEISCPHLVHADLWEGNVLVSNKENDYKLSAIIDGDRSIFGDINYEFASGWMINEYFKKGYSENITENNNDIIRKSIYSMIFNLTDSYVWLAEYNDESNAILNKESALKLLNTLI